MSAPIIRARETIYKGIKMRSRLEARYARILDDLKVDWAYEPQAYAGSTRQYLPDFVIDGELFVEVKPFLSIGDDNYNPFTIIERMKVIAESRPDDTTVLAIATPQLGNFHYSYTSAIPGTPYPEQTCMGAWFGEVGDAYFFQFAGHMEDDIVHWIEDGSGPLNLNWDWKR